ncbi:TPA: hypothetical protein ACOELX_004569 [Enterobacter roggenkampii]
MLFKSIVRGEKNISLDPNGGFLKNFYRPGYFILNAYDKRTEGCFFSMKSAVNMITSA